MPSKSVDLMSAYPKPRNPFAGAAPLAHRPLSAIAATAGGGVPQQRIKRVLAELVPQLEALHAQGRIGGDISVHTVGLDESGRAHFMAPGMPVQGGAQPAVPEPGYAAPELYAAGAHWARGPWSDVYGLSAVAHALVAGKPPPSAAERLEHDTYAPLAEQGLPKYDRYERSFLAAIDQGLALDPADRPRSLAQYAEILAFPATPPVPPEPAASPVSLVPPPQLVEAEPGRPGWRTALLLALLAGGGLALGAYWWDRLSTDDSAVITRSESVPQAPAPAAGPDPVPQVGPGLTQPPAAEPALPALPGSAADPAQPAATGADTPPAGQAPASDSPGLPPATAQEKPRQGPGADAPPPALVTVALDIAPWGEVWIDGKHRGVTPPLKTLRLAPGRYAVEVRNATLPPYRTTLTVRAGRPTVITHTFR